MNLDLSLDERSFQQAAERFAATTVAPVAGDVESRGAMAPGLLAAAARAGLVPCHDDVARLLAVEALATVSAAVATAVAAQAIAADACARAGGEAAGWSAALASGSRIAAMALDDGGVSVEGMTVRGRAPLVAGAAGADLFLLLATGAGGTVAVVVPAGPGVATQSAGELAGIRGLELSAVTLDGARAIVLDGSAAVVERLRLAVVAIALGIGAAAVREALAIVKGRPGVGDESVQAVVADAATEVAAARLLAWKAAARLASGAPATTEVAMAKLAAARAALGAADRALEIAGVESFRRGATVERLVRDARAAEMLLGATDATRMAIAAGTLPRV